MRRIAQWAVFVMIVAGCQSVRPPGSMELYDDTSLMRDEVLKFIPVGTRVDQAQAVMRAHGFHCQELDVLYPEERLLSFSIAKPDPNATVMDHLNPFDHEIRVVMTCDHGRVIDVKAEAYAARP